MTRKKSDPPPGSGRYLCASGEQYGRLTVLAKAAGGERGYRTNTYHCRCECGNLCDVRGFALHQKHRQSCGCLVQVARAANGRANRLRNGNSTRNQIVRAYRKQCAEGRGLECGLTEAEFDALFAGDCVYCGSPPCKTSQYNSPSAFTYNGIDRLDNTLGYVAGNVVSCCLQCNRAKGKMSVDEFIQWAKRLAANIVDHKGEFKPDVRYEIVTK